jgi:hypothetical protein
MRPTDFTRPSRRFARAWVWFEDHSWQLVFALVTCAVLVGIALLASTL